MRVSVFDLDLFYALFNITKFLLLTAFISQSKELFVKKLGLKLHHDIISAMQMYLSDFDLIFTLY